MPTTIDPYRPTSRIPLGTVEHVIVIPALLLAQQRGALLRQIGLTFALAVMLAVVPDSIQAQVVGCDQVAGLSASVSSGANAFNTSGTLTIDYLWNRVGGHATISGSVPGNAVVSSVSVSFGSKTTSDIQLCTACLQHGTSGWPVDFLNDYSGLAVFNSTSVSGSGPWIVRPVLTAETNSSVLEFLVNINWHTPAPPPPAPLSLYCNGPSAPLVKVGQSVSFDCSVSGGTAPFYWSDIGIPPGLILQRDGALARITGAPSASGNYNFGVLVEDTSTPRAQVAIHWFSVSILPEPNALLEFVPDNFGGRLWNAYDHTAATGQQVSGDPAVLTPVGGGAPHIYIRGTANNLVEFVPDNMGGRLWNAYDHTADTGQHVSGDPAVYMALEQKEFMCRLCEWRGVSFA